MQIYEGTTEGLGKTLGDCSTSAAFVEDVTTEVFQKVVTAKA